MVTEIGMCVEVHYRIFTKNFTDNELARVAMVTELAMGI